MKVTVKFDSQLRRWSGSDQCVLEFDEQPSIQDVFQAACNLSDPKLRERLLTADDSPQKTILVFVNGNALPVSSLESCQLKDGDEISLFPPISGG